jgi:hypothetical protein
MAQARERGLLGLVLGGSWVCIYIVTRRACFSERVGWTMVVGHAVYREGKLWRLGMECSGQLCALTQIDRWERKERGMGSKTMQCCSLKAQQRSPVMKQDGPMLACSLQRAEQTAGNNRQTLPEPAQNPSTSRQHHLGWVPWALLNGEPTTEREFSAGFIVHPCTRRSFRLGALAFSHSRALPGYRYS